MAVKGSTINPWMSETIESKVASRRNRNSVAGWHGSVFADQNEMYNFLSAKSHVYRKFCLNYTFVVTKETNLSFCPRYGTE